MTFEIRSKVLFTSSWKIGIWKPCQRSHPRKLMSISAPFDNPTEPGLVGGGSTPSPGEISLAHNGVTLWSF